MKITSSLLSLTLLSAAVLLAGCATKSKRPTPDQTVLGPNGLNPESINTTDANAAGLQQRLPDGVIDDGHLIHGLLPSVYFDLDQSAIKPGERSKLADAAKYLKDNPTKKLLLEGHCDWRGTDEYNLSLGDRRAQSVKKYLIKAGVDESRLETLSKGSLEAIKNGTADQMGHDRRVDLDVKKDDADAGAPATAPAAAPAGGS
ncbi:MAG TPA: OmpA family protein [Opitutaceae bacterium]|jgi:peptidoglycan-associated lipoprotein|nr:OmpA family protein [Opitutaceae bacterium]